MSAPPPGWQPQQPGQPAHNAPPYASQPGNFPPGGQPGVYPQGSWPQPPQPPQGGNTTKLLLIAIAVLLVIGVTVGATLLFTRGTGDATTNPSSTQNASDFASAGDTGPVAIITSEPTCQAFNSINNALADVENRGWGEFRSSLGPQADWTADQRGQVEGVATAMANAADQVEGLAKQTPNRSVREIYEQFIASGRGYAGKIANYTPVDDNLASVNVSASGTIIGICNAIRLGSAGRSILVPPQAGPTHLAELGRPGAFSIVTAPKSVCSDWTNRLDTFNSKTPEWQQRDATIPGTAWTPERRTLERETAPLLQEFVNQAIGAGHASDNAEFEDLSLLSAQYIAAYIAAGETYTNADSWLIYTGFRIANLLSGACRAAG